MSSYVIYQIANLILIMMIVAFLRLLFDRLDTPENKDLFISVFGIGIELVGWYGISHSDSISAARVCYRMTIAGCGFFAIGYIIYMARVYKAKYSNLVMIPEVMVLGVALCESFAGDKGKLYLHDIEITKRSRIVLLLGTRGVFYYLRLLVIAYIGVWSVYIIIRKLVQYKNRKDNRVIANALFYLTAVAIQGASIIVYEMNSDRMVNIVPLIRALCTGIYAWISLKYHILNFDSLARQSLVNDMGAGFIVLSDKYEVLYSNAIADSVLPETETGDRNFFKNVTRRHEYQLEKGGMTYRVTADRVFSNNRIEGYTILIVDVTDVVQLEKQAMMYEKTRQNLLTNISHEIKTPLNAITGASELIDAENATVEDYREYAELIRVSSMNINDILNDLLTASTNYDKLQTTDLVPFSLFTLLDNIIGMCNERLSRKKVKLSVSIAQDIPVNAIGDDRRIRQVILNILSNAIRYTDDGYVSLRVSGEYLKDKRYHYVFTIQDTGKNVFSSEVELDSKSIVGDELAIDYNTGYGISLVVAKKIAQVLDGDVSVFSVKGRENVYSVSIPALLLDNKTLNSYDLDKKLHITLLGEDDSNFEEIKRACYDLNVRVDTVSSISKIRKLYGNEPGHQILMFDYEKYGKRVAVSEKASDYVKVSIVPYKKNVSELEEDFIFVCPPLSPLTLHKILLEQENRLLNQPVSEEAFSAPSAKILVVDDNSLNLSLAKAIIEQYKASVDTAESGFECLELIASGQTYDLIFMDYMMEGLDGIETTKKIRALKSSMKDVPILAYTANAVEDATEKYLSAGMNGCVFKPANASSFAKALKDFLPSELLVFSRQKNVIEDFDPETVFPDIEEVDMESAIRFSGGNISMYTEMLGTFALEIPAKEKKILEYQALGDYKNLSIIVHGIKGTAKTLGMNKLSDLMYEMEKASKDENSEKIKEEIPGLLSYYRKVSKILKPYADKKEESKKRLETAGDVEKILLKMQTHIEEFDLDKLEKHIEELNEFQLDHKKKALIKNLSDAIEKADYYGCKEYVEALLSQYEEK